MAATLESLKRIQGQSSQEIRAYEDRRAQAKSARDLLTQREYWLAARCPALQSGRLVDPKGAVPGWDRAREWAGAAVAAGGIIALVGDRGTGKTQIGVELIRSATLYHLPPYHCVYTRAAELYGALRDDMRADKANEAKAIAAWVKPWLLVIDEAHERNANSDFEPRALNLILDKRYGELRPTVIIANVDGATDIEQAGAFRRLIGETIFDRLSETGGIRCCNWKSFRAKGGQ